jgi:hypothetical protein
MRNLVTVTLVLLCCAFAVVGLSAGRSHAQTPHQSAAPLTYTLKMVGVRDTPQENVWMIEAPDKASMRLDGSAFRSLDSPILRDWVSDLPRGTIIQYWPSSLPIIGHHGNPIHDFEGGIPDFTKFCRDNGVEFGQEPTI